MRTSLANTDGGCVTTTTTSSKVQARVTHSKPGRRTGFNP